MRKISSINFSVFLFIAITISLMYSCDSNKIKSIQGDILLTIEVEKNVFDVVDFHSSDQISRELGINDLVVHARYYAADSVIIGIRPVHGMLIGNPIMFDLKSNKTKVCPGFFYENIFDDPRSGDPNNVIITSALSVDAFNIRKCNLKDTLINFDNNHNDGYRIVGASMSQDGKFLLYSSLQYATETMSINKLELETGLDSFISEGYAPSLSHSGDMIAYVDKENEVVILNLLTNDLTKLATVSRNELFIVPTLDWSMNDKNLLIQTFESGNTDLFENKVYVVDLTNLSMTTLDIKGLFPAWVN